MTGVMTAYQIAAVKIREGKETDCFIHNIKPWDDSKQVKRAAKLLEIEESDLKSEGNDVDEVIKVFFDFVGNDILVSTGILSGAERQSLSRAARYAGMKKIDNELMDILDFAADLDEEFDMENNSREYLLKYFGIEDGKDALAKTRATKLLLEKLSTFEG